MASRLTEYRVQTVTSRKLAVGTARFLASALRRGFLLIHQELKVKHRAREQRKEKCFEGGEKTYPPYGVQPRKIVTYVCKYAFYTPHRVLRKQALFLDIIIEVHGGYRLLGDQWISLLYN